MRCTPTAGVGWCALRHRRRSVQKRCTTMVFTHLPSNVLLALVAAMPTFPLAAVVLLARQVLSQMDVPTRQAYTMALVAPEERTAAASVTSLARSAGSASSPIVGGLLLQGPLLA